MTMKNVNSNKKTYGKGGPQIITLQVMFLFPNAIDI